MRGRAQGADRLRLNGGRIGCLSAYAGITVPIDGTNPSQGGISSAYVPGRQWPFLGLLFKLGLGREPDESFARDRDDL